MTDAFAGRTSGCLRGVGVGTFHAGVACTVGFRCARRTVLGHTVVVVVDPGAAHVGALDALVLVAVRTASVGVLVCTHCAAGDVVTRAFHASAIGTVVFLEDSLAVRGEAVLGALHTEVVGVTECLVGVLSSASVRLLVGLWTFHTLVLLAVGHAWALELAAAIKDRSVAAVGALHTNIVFARKPSTVGCVLRVPLGRTLTALVIHAILEVTVDVLTLVERGETLVWTLVTVVVRAIRFARRLGATRVGFEPCGVAVLTLTTLIHCTIGARW